MVLVNNILSRLTKRKLTVSLQVMKIVPSFRSSTTLINVGTMESAVSVIGIFVVNPVQQINIVLQVGQVVSIILIVVLKELIQVEQQFVTFVLTGSIMISLDKLLHRRAKMIVLLDLTLHPINLRVLCYLH